MKEALVLGAAMLPKRRVGPSVEFSSAFKAGYAMKSFIQTAMRRIPSPIRNYQQLKTPVDNVKGSATLINEGTAKRFPKEYNHILQGAADVDINMFVKIDNMILKAGAKVGYDKNSLVPAMCSSKSSRCNLRQDQERQPHA